jgi:hypothetical protein
MKNCAASVPGQNVEPYRGQRKHQKRREQRIQPIFTGQQRDGYECHREQQHHRDPVLQDRKQLLISSVGGFELTGFAVEHFVNQGRREGEKEGMIESISSSPISMRCSTLDRPRAFTPSLTP